MILKVLLVDKKLKDKKLKIEEKRQILMKG